MLCEPDFEDAVDCVYRRYVTKEYVQQLRNNPFYDIPQKLTTGYRKDVVYYNNEERYDVGDVIEILSGLKGDERVITTGAGQLNDKDKIKVVGAKTTRP